MKFSGVVVRGDGRGRELGFPTANIELKNSEEVHQGVYAGRAKLDNNSEDAGWLEAAIHMGPVPTFEKNSSTIEVHIIDFPDRDLYGEYIEVSVGEKIRDIQKFNSIEELKTAIKEDCQKARKLLQNADQLPPS